MGPYRLHQIVRTEVGILGLFCLQAVADATAGQPMPGDGCSNRNCLCGAEDDGALKVFPLAAPTLQEETQFWDGQVGMAEDSVAR